MWEVIFIHKGHLTKTNSAVQDFNTHTQTEKVSESLQGQDKTNKNGGKKHQGRMEEKTLLYKIRRNTNRTKLMTTENRDGFEIIFLLLYKITLSDKS